MRIILVVGATGQQGGSVARHLLARGQATVRCLTRDGRSMRAGELRQAGAEVVEGDLDDPASLQRALRGCSGLFGVTDYWEHFDREVEQGRHLAEAAATAGIEFAVFSTLPSAAALSDETLDIPHFEQKAQIADYVRALRLPATFVHVSFYYENFLTQIAPRRQPDGSFVVGLPQGEAPLAGVAVADIGGPVASLFDHPDAWIGQTVGIVGDDRPVSAYTEAMSRVTGRTIRYRHLPRDVFAAFGSPGADDLADMFELNRRFIPSREADLSQSRLLFPAIRSFDQWATENRIALRDVIG